MSEKIPCHSPLTVLSADSSPNPKPLGFVVKEYMGSPVLRSKPGVTETKSYADIDTETVLRNRDDLKPGDYVFVPSLWGGLMRVQVQVDSYGVLYGEDKDLHVGLEFDADDRHCWTTAGYCNVKGIKKLSVGK
jgi:hypothetical protein